jgi:hypothetical protein
MAAALFNLYADRSGCLAISAGTEPAHHVHPEVVEVMREIGVDLSSVTPQLLTHNLAKTASVLVTMGCGGDCPHGTVGVLGHQASFHATPGDLLSHFRFGLMGAADARYKRLVLPLDVMWIRLADDKALPFPDIEATSADVKLTEFILTPKIGYRVLDREKFKIDGLTGLRYWHIGQNLEFSPSDAGLNFSGSQNWVDVLVGGRVLATLSPKVELTVAGDVGGWGAAAEMDYRVTSGAIIGVSITLK